MISAVHVGGEKAPENLNLPVIPWMKQGSCRRVKDPDIFFRERAEKGGKTRNVRENTKEAKRICGVCPVAGECLLWALQHDEEFGIWGGSTPDERRIMRKYVQ